ncbi:MAG: hypothetical protein LBC29_05245, partial [Propionibacteriaceae bacterium]|nr:hypothetical protein [Propionibacteriaceae bacterium]
MSKNGGVAKWPGRILAIVLATTLGLSLTGLSAEGEPVNPADTSATASADTTATSTQTTSADPSDAATTPPQDSPTPPADQPIKPQLDGVAPELRCAITGGTHAVMAGQSATVDFEVQASGLSGDA